MSERIQEFLFTYRTTACSSGLDGKATAEIFFGRIATNHP